LSDTADEVEGLLARAFAPRLYDLLTGSSFEDAALQETEAPKFAG
jgi:hypothetical protein